MKGLVIVQGQAERNYWQSLEWGRRLGVMGRESCVWTVLQRELRGMCLLQEKALHRLDSLGFQWQQQV